MWKVSSGARSTVWSGQLLHLIRLLVLKDFKIRYRNMSLGVMWSLLNPIVMMFVLTFIFTEIFPNPGIAHFPVFALCGIVPFNFFAIAWASGTRSVVENASMIKKVPVPREIIPIAAVFSNVLHLLIQMALVLACLVSSGIEVNSHWVWLPVLWVLEILFVCGLALMCSAVNVLIRDTCYVVESVITIAFWLVPVFYSFDLIPDRYREVYEFNPVAALVLSLRRVLLDGAPPNSATLVKLTIVSVSTALIGWLAFRWLEDEFFEHL